jgi:hypothetical protein
MWRLLLHFSRQAIEVPDGILTHSGETAQVASGSTARELPNGSSLVAIAVGKTAKKKTREEMPRVLQIGPDNSGAA